MMIEHECTPTIEQFRSRIEELESELLFTQRTALIAVLACGFISSCH